MRSPRRLSILNPCHSCGAVLIHKNGCKAVESVVQKFEEFMTALDRMASMQTTRGPHGTTFVHNGDFSGEVEIHFGEVPRGFPKFVTRVPFEDLEHIVMEKIRRDTISRFEGMQAKEIVNFLTGGLSGQG